jgi:tetratricopeptide (TPR) repeat protein
MARSIPIVALTDGDELRDLLSRSERLIANLKGKGQEAVVLLNWLDRIYVLLAKLTDSGADWRPEQSTLATVEAILRRQARPFMKEVKDELPKAREEAAATPDRWWWYLDQIAEDQRRKLIRRVVTISTTVVVALVVIYIAMTVTVDPNVRNAMSHTAAAERQYGLGNLEMALKEYETVLQYRPGDVDTMVWIGVLQDELERSDEAQAAYQKAEEAAGSRLGFLLSRTKIYSAMGKLDVALVDINEALSIDPRSAEAHFWLATVYEARGETAKAYDEFAEASDLADAANQTELNAVIRTRMAYLLKLQPAVVTQETTTPGP